MKMGARMSEWPMAHPSFPCACRFKREKDFGPTDLIEPCGYHADMAVRLADSTSALAFAQSEIVKATNRYEEVVIERNESDEVREKLADILSRTAIALKGPEEPLQRHSWHDLPELAQRSVSYAEQLKSAAIRAYDAWLLGSGCSEAENHAMQALRALATRSGEFFASCPVPPDHPAAGERPVEVNARSGSLNSCGCRCDDALGQSCEKCHPLGSGNGVGNPPPLYPSLAAYQRGDYRDAPDSPLPPRTPACEHWDTAATESDPGHEWCRRCGMERWQFKSGEWTIWTAAASDLPVTLPPNCQEAK